eukprot:120882-Pleurochrysis_carterae.AAC.1
MHLVPSRTTSARPCRHLWREHAAILTASPSRARAGLWIEPEMVSTNSKLYEEHPNWCLHLPGRAKAEGRNQLVLDLTRAEASADAHAHAHNGVILRLRTYLLTSLRSRQPPNTSACRLDASLRP